MRRKARSVRTKITGYGGYNVYVVQQIFGDKPPKTTLIGSVVGDTVMLSLRPEDGGSVEVCLTKKKAEALQSFLYSAIGELNDREDAHKQEMERIIKICRETKQ